MPEPLPELELVRSLEERAFNAWPALSTLLVDGWLVRLAEGYTKRANSLNAWRPVVPVTEAIHFAAPLFAARGLPLVVRLSPLAGSACDMTLAGLDYTRHDETLVMGVDLAALAVSLNEAPEATLAAAPSHLWLDGFAAANGVPADRRIIHDRMVGAIVPPAAFATLGPPTTPLAWGLAVAERGWVGLFDIVTRPDARRQGAGRRLVETLLAWGHAKGATRGYLQVVAANAPAIALYRRLGFTEAYRYHYRIAPA